MLIRGRAFFAAVAVAEAVLLSGCVAPPPVSVPISAEAATKGISLSRSLPPVLPRKSVPIPHSQFVLIPSESAAGLVSPMIVISRDAEVIQDSIDTVVVRMSGDMSNPGTSGGLFFGVHYFRKDQLHTFKKL
jgi:hypothetical protein